MSWRRNLVFIWIGLFIGLLGASFVFPFFPFYIEELGIEGESKIAFWTGLTGSATGLSLTFTAPIWGALADRYGRRLMLLRALVGAGIVITLMGFSTSVWHLLGLRFGLGMFAGTMGAAAALVAAGTPRDRVGSALGTLQTGQFAANMLGPVLGGITAATIGLRGAFFACGALFGLAAVSSYLFVREPRSTPAAVPAVETSRPRPSLLDSLRAVSSDRQLRVIFAVLFILWLSTTFVRPILPILINDLAGADDLVTFSLGAWAADLRPEAATGLVFGVLGGTSVIAALSVGPVGNLIGYRNAVAGAALFAGILFLAVMLEQGYTSFLLLFGAVGLFQGGMVPGTNALIAAATPDGRHGSAFGLAASVQSLAILAGPFGGGLTASAFGIRAVFAVIGTLLVAAALIARFAVADRRA